MVTIKKLDVHLRFTDDPIHVGQLLADDGNIYFKYDSSFLETALDISPFKLKRSRDILSPNTPIFDGLFGVFNDSLPDGWGKLLLDRTLLSRGIAPNEITPLDRLAYVGSYGMGALTYTPSLQKEIGDEVMLQLDTLSQEMDQILAGNPSEIIDSLYNLGGSSGGARPKIIIGYHEKKNHLISGNQELPKGYEHWIIKFAAATDVTDIAQVEYAYHNMALAAGLKMSECRLFEGASGKSYFATKRFDRIKNGRLHLHSASGLLHDNYRYSNLDYGNIMDCASRLENHLGALDHVLRLAAFNVYSHNRDDHSKNIAFLMNKQGQWKLAPVYDLTFSHSSHGMHSTTVAREGKAPGEKHLLELADTFGVRNPKRIIAQVRDAISEWETFARESGVTPESKMRIKNVLGSIGR